MKRKVGILFLILIMFATVCFAAFPAELEGKENEEGLEDFGTLDTESIEENINYEDFFMPISEDEDVKKQENIILDDVYKMEETVTVNYDVDGNVYIMAQKIKIENAMINGNVYVMAEKIEISDSQITGSVYALGEEIVFSSKAQDMYACGSNININNNATIVRNLKVAGDTLNISGNVQRNVDAGVSSLNVSETTKINGKLNYHSENEGEISTQAQVGEVIFTQEEIEDISVKEENTVQEIIREILAVCFKTLIVALIVVLCTNKFYNLKRTENAVSDYMKDLGKGAAFLVLVPIISIALFCTILGIGLGFVLWAIYIIAFYIAIPLFSIETANRILLKKSNDTKKPAIIGLSILVSIIIWAFKFVPLVGGILKFIIILIGLGIIVNLMFEKKSKEVINEN